ncbi:MAG: 23S rRNA (guanosine(2251)-2'-O)-methyltransferase RlmB [Saprospiraceae bacterium]|nr:23S rRNA (guanosine(2251)-2'-O)-methyltransferase RlmB [Saprospiraceae bacterium]MDW8483987.1 23S rRNA (guanosine(2251)-2'-O)-methyltransferase RlmB [Saprospiraceae bacterium]
MSQVIYGYHPVVEAIKAGRPVEKVFFQQGLRGEVERELRLLTRERGIPMQVVPRAKLDRLVRGVHQGVAAWLSAVVYQSLEEAWAEISHLGSPPLLVLLDGVTDVRNFGAICRSAECAGAHGVVVPQSGVAPANEAAMKASAGALARIRLCRVRSIYTALEWLQQQEVCVVATGVSPSARLLFEVDFTGPTALLFGAEHTGLAPRLLRMADVVARIPQATDFDSYNVSVAAGICLYEALRQRLVSTSGLG